MRFEGTSAYIATADLKVAVNAAIALERPLLVKGEPGTGKTVLARRGGEGIGAPLIEWHIKSTTKAAHGLYEYDAVRACATVSSAIRAYRTSTTTSAAASCGTRSGRSSGRCC